MSRHPGRRPIDRLVRELRGPCVRVASDPLATLRRMMDPILRQAPTSGTYLADLSISSALYCSPSSAPALPSSPGTRCPVHARLHREGTARRTPPQRDF